MNHSPIPRAFWSLFFFLVACFFILIVATNTTVNEQLFWFIIIGSAIFSLVIVGPVKIVSLVNYKLNAFLNSTFLPILYLISTILLSMLTTALTASNYCDVQFPTAMLSAYRTDCISVMLWPQFIALLIINVFVFSYLDHIIPSQRLKHYFEQLSSQGQDDRIPL